MENLKIGRLVKNALLCANPFFFSAVTATSVPRPETEFKKFEEKSVKVGNQLITYNISYPRHKKTIILQHGAFMNNLTMMKLAMLFRGYSVIVPNMAGHGKSESPVPIKSVETLADIEYDFIKALKQNGEIESDADITYAGWSLGGSIGLQMSLKERIFDRLVLISSAPVWNTIPLISEDKFYDAFKDMFMSAFSPDTSKARIEWCRRDFDNMLSSVEVSENDIAALKDFDFTQKLKCVPHPTLIICGTNDNLCPAEEEIKMVSNIAKSKLVMYHGETHTMVIDHPEKVHANIIDFINRKSIL